MSTPTRAASRTPAALSAASKVSARSGATATSNPPDVWASARINCSALLRLTSYVTQSVKKRRLACVPPVATPAWTYSHAAGKTGTAEKFVRLPGFQGLQDQAWWCGYGPYANPKLVVCALIENGGHGGTAAAPAALKVFEEYFKVDPESYVASIKDSD